MVENLIKRVKEMIHKRSISFLQLIALSYAFFLLFPIIVNMLVYVKTEDIVTEEITELSENQCFMLSRQFDAQFNVVESVMTHVLSNEKIKDFTKMVTYADEIGNYNYEAAFVTKELNNMLLNISNISEVFLYFKELNLVISNSGVMNKSVAYDLYAPKTLKFDEWKKKMSDEYSRELIGMNHDSILEGNGRDFAYFHTITFDNFPVTLVITMFGDEFFNIMGDESGSRISTFIVKNNGKVLTNANSEFEFPVDIVQRTIGKNTSFTYKINHGNNEVWSIVSNTIKSAHYVFFIPRDVLLKKVRNIRGITFLSLWGIMTLGFAGIFYLSKKNSAPVTNMINSIAVKLGIEPEQCVRKYDQFTGIVKKKIDIFEKNSSNQNKILKNYFLSELLLEEPRESDARILEKAKEFNVYYEDVDYRVILIDVYDSHRFCEGSDTKDNDSLVQFVLNNIFSDLFATYYHMTSVPMKELDSGIALIIVDGDSDEICDIIREAYNFTAREFGIYFTASISGSHTKDEWSEAYLEAISVLVRKISHDEQDDADVLICRYLHENVNSGYVLSDEYEKKLTNYIISANVCEAKQLIGTAIDDCKNKPVDYLTNIKFNILNSMLRALPADICDRYCNEVSPAILLAGCKTPDSAKQRLFALVEELMQYLQKYGGNEKVYNTFAKKIIDYVGENYSDIGLSITMVAEYFGMNAHYIAKQFKEITGESLRNYINVCRIEKSKELLVETNDSMKEIAKKTGFIDNNAYIRVFKKAEGITPGLYRKNHMK